MDLTPVHCALNRFSLVELKNFATQFFRIPRAAHHNKSVLVDLIVQQAPRGSIHEFLNREDDSLRRRRTPSSGPRVQAPVAPSLPPWGHFMELPSLDDVKRCYREFIRHTNNHALRRRICAVCARENDFVSPTNYQTMALSEIPNRHRLQPAVPHPQHTLFSGLLLEPTGVHVHNGQTRVQICDECLSHLKRRKPNTVPPLALANNMWIGDIPDCISRLSLAESLLVSLVNPHVFVFKLFPKSNIRLENDETQRAMRGHVVSYENDVQGVSSMLEGQLLPRHPSVLPSLVSITFLGKGKPSIQSLKALFRVRRGLLWDVLQFFRNNNPYYQNISVDTEVLNILPNDDIPSELLAIIRQSTDEHAVDAETGAYIPDGNDEDISDSTSHDGSIDVSDLNIPTSLSQQDSADPRVFPLQISGTVDMDHNKLSSQELMNFALSNLWEQGHEGTYAVRRGHQPVRDFPPLRDSEDQSNFFEKAFPTLFPYGVGGIEAPRPIRVDFNIHVRWALQYHDRRFRQHETFPFVTFGISQRRQAFASSKVQMLRHDFERESRLFQTLTPADLQRAVDEEQNHQQFSNPVVRNLFSQIHTTAARCQGSNSNRYRRRNQIYAITYACNPQTLWMTFNLSDIHHPIAQIYAGEDIDMDNFLRSVGPDAHQRARNVAKDPLAAAGFFHRMIRLILETLFQTKVTNFRVHSTMGLLGHVAGYFGMVEAQGRGSLHCHIMFWLKDAPDKDTMRRLLETEDFRNHVRQYIAESIHAWAPGLDSPESVKLIPNETDIAYNRPPNPDAADFQEQCLVREVQVVRSQQIHTCSLRRCLIRDKHGRLVCKRHAPFPCSPEPFVDANGNWGPKRLHPMINGYTPHISIITGSNMDAKLLTNGRDTNCVSEYVTKYTTKNQPQSTNTAALIAKDFCYHQTRVANDERYLGNLLQQQRMLLFRLASSLNVSQEMSAPMVVSLLMGWDDCLCSHSFTVVYWPSFVSLLLQVFPELRRPLENSEPPTAPSEAGHELPNGEDEESHLDTVELIFDQNGHLQTKHQLGDYMLRGELLCNYGVYQFFKDTWETERQKHDTEEIWIPQGGSGAGRPRHQRIIYLPSHPAHRTRCRVLRNPGHNNLPSFTGRHFPRSDDTSQRHFYCASMLMLFKPWRRLDRDLKSPNETWDHAWTSFLSTAPPWISKVVSNIQYYYDCQPPQDDETSALQGVNPLSDNSSSSSILEGLHFDMEGPDISVSQLSSGELMAATIDQLDQSSDSSFATMAISVAEMAGLFQNVGQSVWSFSPSMHVYRAEGQDLARLIEWRQLLDNESNSDSSATSLLGETAPNTTGSSSSFRSTGDVGPSVFPLNGVSESQAHHCRPFHLTPEYDVFFKSLGVELNEEQRLSFDILSCHLDDTLAGFHPPPLRMKLVGSGGTGKTRVIDTVTKFFELRGQRALLLKSAFTGIAACLIEGQTLHYLGHISVSANGECRISEKVKRILHTIFRTARYIIIDEFSMLYKTFFALFSKRVAIGKSAEDPSALMKSFGGISVLLAGDFHQFPPVAKMHDEFLFVPNDIARVSPTKTLREIGGMLYQEFNRVVILRQQKRVQDPVWLDFLNALRSGQVTPNHLEMLRTLLLKPDEVDFSQPNNPWLSASLITPRHSVRLAWNSAAIRRHCQLSRQRLYICPADETLNHSPLTQSQALRLKLALNNRRKHGNRKDLPGTVELAIGAQVLVTRNLDIDLDVANGAKAEVVDIILDPNEPPIPDDQVEVKLRYLPVYILVRMHRTRASTLPGLENRVIPIEPLMQKVSIEVPNPRPGHAPLKRIIVRRQFPVTGAYAFTDYRAQGQTLVPVIVDITKPPHGSLSLFNLYVALSRGIGRDHIRILRDFQDSMFFQTIDQDLQLEDDRLEQQFTETLRWWEAFQHTHEW